MHLEVADTDQENALRRAMAALYISRTPQGTLDEAGEIELSPRTLEMVGDRLLDIQAASLTVACRHWADYARRLIDVKKLTLAELRHELELIAQGLYTATGIRPTDA